MLLGAAALYAAGGAAYNHWVPDVAQGFTGWHALGLGLLDGLRKHPPGLADVAQSLRALGAQSLGGVGHGVECSAGRLYGLRLPQWCVARHFSGAESAARRPGVAFDVYVGEYYASGVGDCCQSFPPARHEEYSRPAGVFEQRLLACHWRTGA